MSKTAKPLTALQVESAKKPGLYADGNGLYLHVAASGAKSWIFRYQLSGRPRRDMGLGSLNMPTFPLSNGKVLTGLDAVREIAIDLRRKVKAGIDPLDEKRAAQAKLAPPRMVTFKQVAEQYIGAHQHEWRNKRAWPAMLKNHVYPIIGDRAVASIDLPAVREVLDPIWASKMMTATSVRNKLEAILSYARVSKYRTGENPARWTDNLDHLLAKPSETLKRTRKNREALPYAELPAFMAELRAREGITAAAIEFTILTAARINEVRMATWANVDLDNGIWTIPGETAKSGDTFRRPLSAAAVELLLRIKKLTGGGALIFPGRANEPMRKATAREFLQRLRGEAITVHGFRSTFRDWAAERTSHPREIQEMALAHTVGSETERAYWRSENIEKLRALANDWARFCDQGEPGRVIPIRSNRRH